MFNLPSANLNRRRLLLGLASASAAGATVALAGAATIAAIESPTLLRLADELPALEASYLTALADKRAAYSRGMKNWPLAPEVLIRNYSSYDSLERDVAGAGIRREDGKSANLWSISDARYSVDVIKDALKRRRKDPERPFGVGRFIGQDTAAGWRTTLEECEASLQAAESYYATVARLRDECGYHAAEQADEVARKALIAHVDAIMAETPNTMAGVIIHAQALAAFGKVEQFFRVCEPTSWPWASSFAASVLRIAEEAPAEHA